MACEPRPSTSALLRPSPSVVINMGYMQVIRRCHRYSAVADVPEHIHCIEHIVLHSIDKLISDFLSLIVSVVTFLH